MAKLDDAKQGRNLTRARALKLAAIGAVATTMAASSELIGTNPVRAADQGPASFVTGLGYAVNAQDADNTTGAVVAQNTAPSGTGVIGRGAGNSENADFYGVWGEATNGIGVYGSSMNGTAVYGLSGDGVAVKARSTGANFALHASATIASGAYIDTKSKYGVGLAVYGVDGAAIQAVAQGGTGVQASSNSGPGLAATSTKGRGITTAGGPAQIRLQPSTSPTHPARGMAGDLFVDASNRLWFCKGATNWVKLA